ncbi:ribokinase-like [Lineus longissimus]|uniref:ribokinase-like n=1 Tax=Lineus longissimus TaxID=88925 RepID=UPI002B4EAD07
MDVVVVGSCNIDLISYVPRLPKAGETLHGHKFAIGFGGKGANQCVVASRLGTTTAMVAKLGDDTFGHDYIQNFKDNSVNIDHVSVTKEASSGVAPIAVNDDGQNAIVIVSGANLKLSEEDLNKAENIIKSSKVMVCQLEVRPEITLAALRMAKKHGVTSILNPAPSQPSLDPEMFQTCDIFCPNETETEILTGLPVSSVDDAKTATKALLDRGCKMVIITLGSQGCVLASKDKPEAVHILARSVTPVDTTGAGDAFVGALASYLAKYPDLGMEETIRRSCEIATISVQAPGTQTSYPWKKDLPSELF